MRLRSLRIRRYGHFEEESIDLGEGATVVLGPNEAGKSTVLDAVGDFLWGVRSQRHPRAFKYAPKSMELVGAVDFGGQNRTYTRNLKSLKEAGKEVSPPWDPELTRDAKAWRSMFGLNLVGLQQGGREVIAGRGDLADLIFLAETGQVIKKVRAELADRMDDIFKERKNTSCAIRDAIADISRLEDSLEDSEASAADVTALRESIRDLEERRATLAEKALKVGRKERRSNELIRCFPIAAQLRELQRELSALQASGRVLSTGDTKALDDAVRDRVAARKKVADIESDIQGRQQRREQLSLSPDLLAAQDAITTLQQSLDARRQDQSAIAGTGVLDALRDTVIGILRKLGRAPGPDLSSDVESLMLADASRDSLTRLATAATQATAKADERAAEVRRLETEDNSTECTETQDTELSQARSDRDAAWQAVRAPWLSGDLPESDVRRTMADSVDRTLVFADETAERMADQLEATAQQRGQDAERAKQLSAAHSELRRLQQEAEKAVQDWKRVAADCGLPPGTDPTGWKVHDKLLTELGVAWQEARRHEEAVASASERWATFCDQVRALDSLSASSHSDPILRVQSLAAALTEASNADSKAEEIDQELNSLSIELGDEERSLRKADQTIAELTSGVEESLDDLLERGKGVIDKRSQIDNTTEQLKGAKEPDTALAELIEELENADLETLKAGWEEANTTQAEIARDVSELDAELGANRKELSTLESRDSAAHIRASEITEGERLVSLIEEYQSLRLQVELLDLFSAELVQSADSPVLETAGAILAKLTSGRYSGFEVVDEGESRHIEVLFTGSTTDDTEPVTTRLDALSDGTADQVFLALRLAGISSRQEERRRAGLPTLPVVLDDVLMAHDDTRTGAALEAIAELSSSMQVIVLTHHGRVGESAAEIPGITCVELRPVIGSD